MPPVSEVNAILKFATIKTIIPTKTSPIDTKDNEDGDTFDLSTILDAEQRDKLFFDELLRLHVVLSLPQCDEGRLQSILSRIDLRVEAWISNADENVSNASNVSGSNRELISSQHISHDEDPLVLVTEGEDHQVRINLVWKTAVTLNRPHARFAEPHIIIVPSAIIRPEDISGPHIQYLQPYTVQQSDVFRSLSQARGFHNEATSSSGAKLQSQPQRHTAEDGFYTIKSISSHPFKIYLALSTRLKYAKAWGQELTPALTACLEMEMLPFLEARGEIAEVQMKLTAGTVFDLSRNILPLQCHSRECVTLLYQLESLGRKDAISKAEVKSVVDTLNVSIRLVLNLSAICKPEIFISWATDVDFSRTLHQTGPTQVMQRLNRPPDIQLSAAALLNSPDRHSTSSDQPLTISLSAPDEPGKAGMPFAWKVLVVNNSTKVAKLAIVPIPKLQRTTSQVQQYVRRHASKTSNASNTRGDKPKPDIDDDIAPAYVDDNIAYAMQHSGAMPAEIEVISLTSELNIGPLAPGQCHEDEIKLVAYKAGVFTLDAVRVVDLHREMQENLGFSGGIVDLHDLPDIIITG